MISPVIVAIDGPSGVGKSTVARLIAKSLGLRYLDTGAMYRAAGLLARRAGLSLPLSNGEDVARLTSSATIEILNSQAGTRTLLNGEDVSEEIREPEIARYASAVASIPAVRRKLASLQREMALCGGGVMEGRDIGTKVVPETPFKFFLDASSDVRAERRFRELSAKGLDVKIETVLAEQRARDEADSTRTDSPLVCDASYVRVDTSNLSSVDVAEVCLAEIKKRIPG
ncbi:MAG: (d)CMP kinase [Thermoanaerobaculia bacterium]|nr:Cytidylate kinase [Thermoanaerobaculia bacterium]MCK6681896.1 (d)CMP kinase [Thermoanaerobaculia bacterium]